MCRDLILRRKPFVPTTFVNIITTTATPTLRARTSRISEGEDRGEGDKWSPCRLRAGRPFHPPQRCEVIRRCRGPVGKPTPRGGRRGRMSASTLVFVPTP